MYMYVYMYIHVYVHVDVTVAILWSPVGVLGLLTVPFVVVLDFSSVPFVIRSRFLGCSLLPSLPFHLGGLFA